MDKDSWQRLRNLSLFKLWVTDRQLSRILPYAALIAIVLSLVVAAAYLLSG